MTSHTENLLLSIEWCQAKHIKLLMISHWNNIIKKKKVYEVSKSNIKSNFRHSSIPLILPVYG